MRGCIYRSGELELYVALFEDSELIICDGNTRATAVFECAKDDGQTGVVLPVFVITAVVG